MPPVFGPAVAVEDALVVLRGRQRHARARRRTARAARAPRPRGAPRPRRARSPKRRSTSKPRSAARACASSCGDDDALAGGQAVGLEHDRVALDRRHPVLDGRRPRATSAVGTPAASMISLANALEPSSRAAARVGPEGRRCPRRPSASTRPATSGASGPTTTRSTPSLARGRDQPGRRRRRRRRAARASRAMPGVAGRARGARAPAASAPARGRSRARARRRRRRGPSRRSRATAMKSSIGIAASVS